MNASLKSKSQGPGRPKDMEKRAAILEAAKGLFVQSNFSGTSMDAVAAAAGVSKLTVYSHFGDKDSLFREVVRSYVQDRMPEEIFSAPPGASIRETLTNIARAHAALDTNSIAAGTFRAIMSDCQQGNPRFGRLLWEEGPARTHKLMQRVLQVAVDHEQLAIDDVSRAASQFIALLKGDLLLRRMLGCEDCVIEFSREVSTNALAAVDMFLRAYAMPSR